MKVFVLFAHLYCWVCWTLLCLCRPFCIFERCLDSNPESCRSKQTRNVIPCDNFSCSTIVCKVLNQIQQNVIIMYASNVVVWRKRTVCCPQKTYMQGIELSAVRPACRVSSFPALFPELAFSTAVGAPRLQDDKYLLKWLKLWLICLNTYWRFKNILVTVISNLHSLKFV